MAFVHVIHKQMALMGSAAKLFDLDAIEARK